MNDASKGVELNWAGQSIRVGEPHGGKAQFLRAGSPSVLGEPVKVRPVEARGRARIGMTPEERAKRQSEMMKQRWARNRPEMLLNVIEVARQANLKAGQRKKRLLLVR